MEVLLDAKSQTAMYCQGGGAVAEVIGVRCNGWTHVKGTVFYQKEINMESHIVDFVR